MIVGHATFAFTLATLAVHWWTDHSPTSAVTVGVVAASFALIPDIDILYAVGGVLRTGHGDVWHLTQVFWTHSARVHRGVTHAVPVAMSVATICAASVTPRGRVLALGGTVGLLAVVGTTTSLLAAGILSVAVVLGCLVSLIAWRYTPLSHRGLTAAAWLGFVSHPFGDVFTGTPPAFGYPLVGPVLTTRITLVPDPTLNLLVVFAGELGFVWLALVTSCYVLGQSVIAYVTRWGAIGLVYGSVTGVVPPPTLDVSYPFVGSILLLGCVGGLVTLLVDWRQHELGVQSVVTSGVTGVVTVTVAWATYLLLYVGLG